MPVESACTAYLGNMLRVVRLRCPAFTGVRAMATNPYPPPPPGRGATADLCDIHIKEPVDTIVEGSGVQIMQSIFRDYGKRTRFSGQVSTVKCHESNPRVRAALEEEGQGRVLVVDAGGSQRCAVLGDNLAAMGARNGWAGVVVNGCIRDSEDIAGMEIGVKALNTHPLKSSKRDPGLRDVPVVVAGTLVTPGDWLYADRDGILVAPYELSMDGDK
ncbi:RRAA1 [Auxenochlorella protothecoides x Auxenochlorella symbiontica]